MNENISEIEKEKKTKRNCRKKKIVNKFIENSGKKIIGPW